ncbi:MAG: ATP-binding protein [Desulfosarcina sp.]
MKNDYPHFRRLWIRVLVALMGAAFIPLVVIGGIFSLYAVAIYKSRTVEMLVRDAALHRQHLDQFLEDRIMALRLVARAPIGMLTEPDRFDDYTQGLSGEIPWIRDLGVFDLEGNLLSYQGPFTRETRNYSQQPWFRKTRDAGVCIGDLELGYRQLPHISMAVRRDRDLTSLIVRASIDVEILARQLSQTEKTFPAADYFLVDRNGRYLTQPHARWRPMAQSALGAQAPFDGIRTDVTGDDILLTTWLSAAPWVLAARFDADEVFAPALEMRYLSVWALIIGGVIIVFFVLLAANALVSRLEAKRQRIQHLNHQLMRSSYMTSTMQLGVGLLQEILDRLATISVASQWMANRLAGAAEAQVEADLQQIRQSAAIAQEQLKQFLSRLHPAAPVISDVNLARMTEEVVAWLEKELTLRCIRVTWTIDPVVPEIRTDRSRLRHAIQNILLNGMQAVDKHGAINIAIATDGQGAAITISDNGPGIPASERERIFEPLFTTKPDGTGLGLPVARDILQALGGSLALLQPPAGGAAFKIVLSASYSGPADPEATAPKAARGGT